MTEDANTDCKLGGRKVASILRAVADVIEKHERADIEQIVQALSIASSSARALKVLAEQPFPLSEKKQ